MLIFITILGEQSASTDDDTEIVCENGVCFKRPKQNKTDAVVTENGTSDGVASSSDSQFTNEEKLARAKELIEKKRKEKEEEDARVSDTAYKSSVFHFFSY